MATNIDIVRTGYASYRRGDILTARAMFAEDIEWSEPRVLRGSVGCLFRGRDQVLVRVFAPVPEVHDALALEALEFSGDGDTVTVTGVLHVPPNGTPALDVPFAHVWTVHGGRIDGLRSCVDAHGAAERDVAADA